VFQNLNYIAYGYGFEKCALLCELLKKSEHASLDLIHSVGFGHFSETIVN